jgi:CheY-like chemotaxis protein
MLHNLGHQVDIASDGQEALNCLLARDYDLVLMDIHMPNLDGLHATRAIREQVPAERQPQIVAMTASSLPEDRRAATESGMDGYLLKPVRIADLEEVLAVVPPPGSAVTAVAPTTDSLAVGELTREGLVGIPEQAGPPAFSPAVDLTVLRKLTVDMGAESPEATADLVEAYLEQGATWMADLTVAARRADLAQIRMIAHTLGSSSLLLGAQRLADLLTEAGRIARHEGEPQHDQVGLVLSADAVTGEYRRVDGELRAVLAQTRTVAGESDGASGGVGQ